MRFTGIHIGAALAVLLLGACAAPERPDNGTASPSPAPSAPAHTTVVAVASVSPILAPTSTPTVVPAATPVVPLTTAKPQPAARPTPQPAASAVPAPTASIPTVAPSSIAPLAAPDAQPQIVNVSISKTTVHGGDTVSGEVVTSSNVASVELRIAGFSMTMPKTGPGHFALSYTVPNVPFFLHKTYTMNVIARNARGDAASTSLPIAVR